MNNGVYYFKCGTTSIFLELYLHLVAGQMVVTDQSSSSLRAVALSHCGLSYAIGMAFGPMIGGVVTSYAG